MRLTLSLLGHTLDLGLEADTRECVHNCDHGSSLDGGTTASYPVGFSPWPVPEEIEAPQHCPSWDEPLEGRA